MSPADMRYVTCSQMKSLTVTDISVLKPAKVFPSAQLVIIAIAFFGEKKITMEKWNILNPLCIISGTVYAKA